MNSILKQRSLDSKITWRQRFARSQVLSLLERMPLGRLNVVFPDGQECSFGENPDDIFATIKVFSDELFERCLIYGDLGLAESYMDGLCDLESIRSVVSWFLLNQDSPVLNESKHASRVINMLGAINKVRHYLRPNSRSMSRRNISDHYDLSNDFFQLFLDESMTYSSALFLKPGITLAEAQLAKFERIANQLRISSQDRVLDLGCGWGGLSCYLAKTFGCRVTALTISKQQFQYAKNLILSEGLQDLIDLRLEDYRDHAGSYDKIVSVEMIEAVGDRYMDLFIAKADSLLSRNGLLLFQMITCADSRYSILKTNVDFIQKHVFPGSLLPSLARVNSAMMRSGDIFLVDLFDMTDSYVATLRAWQDSFESQLERVVAMGFDRRFIRKWRYYLEYCQAAFAMRNVSVVQATYSRPNNRILCLERGRYD